MFKVLDKTLEKRLSAWQTLRTHLETTLTPFDDVVNFFNQFPKTKIYTDPYNQKTWPSPWELIEENEYCSFNLILGICYTLQLCERFQSIKPKITITIDKKDNSVYYLLFIDDKVYGIPDHEWVNVNDLSKSLTHIKIYNMIPLH